MSANDIMLPALAVLGIASGLRSILRYSVLKLSISNILFSRLAITSCPCDEREDYVMVVVKVLTESISPSCFFGTAQAFS